MSGDDVATTRTNGPSSLDELSLLQRQHLTANDTRYAHPPEECEEEDDEAD